jgi:hypothetical protein
MAIILNILLLLLYVWFYKQNTKVARYAVSPEKRMKAQFWRGADAALVGVLVVSLVGKLLN